MKPQIAASVFSALTLMTMLFQLALALGAPWGEFAWGGAYPGTLPAAMRFASAGAILVLAAFMGIVLARAGLAVRAWQGASRRLIWVIVAYCALGVVANAATPSAPERVLWLPVTLILLLCSTIVATAR